MFSPLALLSAFAYVYTVRQGVVFDLVVQFAIANADGPFHVSGLLSALKGGLSSAVSCRSNTSRVREGGNIEVENREVRQETGRRFLTRL